MTFMHRTLLAGVVALPLVAGSPVAAQTSAEEIWEVWQALAASQGQELSVEQLLTEGDGLRLSGLTAKHSDDTGTLTARIDTVLLTPVGDGLEVRVPGDQLFLLTSQGTDDHSAETVVKIGEADLVLTAIGAADEAEYAVMSDGLSLTIDSVTSEGQKLPVEFAIKMSELSGALSGWSPSAELPANGMFEAAAVAIVSDIVDVTTGARVEATVTQQDVTATLGAAASGDSTRLDIKMGKADSFTHQTMPDGSEIIVSSSQESGNLVIETGSRNVSYGLASDQVKFDIQSSMLPIGSIAMTIDKADGTFSLPVEPASGAQTAHLTLDLSGMTFPESVWSMIDPGQNVPRNPAALSLDAQADVLVTDQRLPGLEALYDGGVNYLPQGFRINDLQFGFADAQLDASGAFTIETPDAGNAMPNLIEPVGALDVSLKGGLALLEQLVASGLVSQQQAMGAQMMIGMFATTGEGDSLNSTIETHPGGGLTINGTRLR